MAIQFRDRTIDDFKGKLVGGGARPNLFEVQIQLPTGLGVASPGSGSEQSIEEKMRFMVKAAQLPASTVGDIPVAFRGRILHVAGDRTFDPWTVTVINDTDFSIRSAMERWMNAVNNHKYDSGTIDPNAYQQDASVLQLGRLPDREGTKQIPVLRKYKFHGIYPTQVTAIDLDYASTDTIEEFQVQFQVNWWEAFRVGQGDAEADDLSN
jgi:hypothetical protein